MLSHGLGVTSSKMRSLSFLCCETAPEVDRARANGESEVFYYRTVIRSEVNLSSKVKVPSVRSEVHFSSKVKGQSVSAVVIKTKPMHAESESNCSVVIITSSGRSTLK